MTSIVAHLQNLYFSENKPTELIPLDILLLSYLILRQTEDHFVYDSQLTLANRLGCERKAVAKSIKRLNDMGWIVSTVPRNWNEKTQRNTRSIGKTVGLSVNLEKFPQPKDKAKHSSPSPDAVKLAANHTEFLKQLGVSTKYKHFGRQQEQAAQRLIEKLGDFQAVVDLIQFAIEDQRFRSAAYKSLYEIRTRLPTIKSAYDAAQSAAVSSLTRPDSG